jgi:hypothetical protein
LVVPIEACGRNNQVPPRRALQQSVGPGRAFGPKCDEGKVLLGILPTMVEERQMQARLGVDEADVQVFRSKLAGTVQFWKSLGEHNARGGGRPSVAFLVRPFQVAHELRYMRQADQPDRRYQYGSRGRVSRGKSARPSSYNDNLLRLGHAAVC